MIISKLNYLSLSLSLIFLHKYLEVDLLVEEEEEEGEVVVAK